MIDKIFHNLRDLPSEHVLDSGTPMCAGCGGLAAIHQLYDILGERSVFVNAAGCMTLLSVYPFTPFRGSWLYTSMSSAAAGAQGIVDALEILARKNPASSSGRMKVIVLAGDGSSYGMGLSATSAAIDRNLDFIYVCYDNEGYGNTGQQYSAATPYGAKTSTSKGPSGYFGNKKDLFAIWAANQPNYAATIIGAEPLDLARKVKKAAECKGPALLLCLSPCPTGWGYDPSLSIEIGKMAVQTGIWPLKEYLHEEIIHNKIPRPRPPVERYLRLQSRFSHLFNPTLNTPMLNAIQSRVDAYWEKVISQEGA
ncbi:MAG: thiamine pyrophosphate-dependent enzyme [Desulfobulbaceae bacterium]|nr:thiamine pyrophosphate-dependent enzyme [Desulfobulbaceae bacterium]